VEAARKAPGQIATLILPADTAWGEAEGPVNAKAPAPRERVAEGVVQIQTASGLGSGFIIDPSGYIVTNNHVIDDSDAITVILSDGISLPARVVGRDTKTDLALLKVTSKRPLPATRLPANRGQPPAASVALPWYSAQLVQTWPVANLGNLALSTLLASAL
jgi:S1-C subfamily serine protease